MRFDDRIATLLTLPGTDEHDTAVRWRQLVDVAARAGEEEENSAPFIAAVAVIKADAPRIPLALRAAAARAIAGRPVPPALLEVFAADRLAVNAPLLAALPDRQPLLRRLYDLADADSRRFLETLYPQLAKPSGNEPSLHDVVSRVEKRREEVEENGEAEVTTLPPRRPRPVPTPEPRPVEAPVAETPPVSPPATRQEPVPKPSPPPAPAPDDPDVLVRPETSDPKALRELAHEIRTPLNAIIGFAEIIDGQYLGPANEKYRERAAEIVAQARILLGAIDDLDFAARLRSGSKEDRAAPVAAGELLKEMVPDLRAVADRHGTALQVEVEGSDDMPTVDRMIAGRLLRRILSALLLAANKGEVIGVRLSKRDGIVRFVIRRPRALNGRDATSLLDPALTLESEGQALLGLGFSLRLVRGLARVAGGDLIVDAEAILLDIPQLD
ncbi:sensor histidine kinase [Sphingomicrobium lutaoense]|uniref:histidine kinase n=1 Tax=Sphingomicrobium lutaoense TaxID=515949 RepID=A0A839Z257_9SPHN|nr:HAMP domain-containing histidine kinase [Sphingomicrobium lutaoense]MBB3763742.1 hypothetical protein [Sphingomicrobium lutaoense]